MIIKSIHIKNIVNFKDNIINFTNGINVIVGINGVGKSLLLKCIELALFPSSRDTFLEKDYFIELIFILNETEYTVSRSKGIFEIKYNDSLIYGKKKSVEFLYSLYGLEDNETSLNNYVNLLFIRPSDNILFKSSKSIREAYFNKLFNLDKYKNAYNKCNDLITQETILRNNLTQEIGLLTQEILYVQQNLSKYDKIILEIENEKFILSEYMTELPLLKEYLDANEFNYNNYKHNNSKELVCPHCGESVFNNKKEVSSDFNIHTYNNNKDRYIVLLKCIGSIQDKLKSYSTIIDLLSDSKILIDTKLKRIDECNIQIVNHNKSLEKNGLVKEFLKVLPIHMVESILANISERCSYYANFIFSDSNVLIKDSYDIYYNNKEFSVLSSGESALISLIIKLSLHDYLINNLGLLFIDEITANLDSINKFKVLDLLNILDKSQLFIVSHDDTFNYNANNIINLELKNNCIEIKTT